MTPAIDPETLSPSQSDYLFNKYHWLTWEKLREGLSREDLQALDLEIRTRPPRKETQ